ncbi:AraC family transcriptional regulator [Pediococcus acidilactici NGRI 0510Q]|uniref:Helix-turn-helix transcriptional regulator n=1 Tax=Pediococcus acidilactici TaxID=1254 RepID=A0AAW8YHR7_PEDAC|nr:helix-turn-helix domain-containing protein [Pediococcus acidilactici]KRN90476.1 hypothetical protein IV82_GL001584 [Pediococcus acidilactici]MDV2621797.1 helix-turn-helix transcriptional regulator [Pediococcus acidilactici]QQC13955.1 AraC family transcriptional regulator [Pediococcus acidilactici]GAC45682.1 AraC family transcriptional regulator [Pediococcus acidilactici NGRI 0510Q]
MRYSFGITDYSLPLYIESLSNYWEQEDINRYQGYPYVHWLQCIEGAGTILIDNKEFSLDKGQGILIDRDVPHAYHSSKGKWITAYLTFGGELIVEILATLNIRNFVKVEDPDSELRQFIDECYKKIQREPTDSYQTSAMVYRLLTLVKKNQIRNRANQRVFIEIINPIIDFIKENYKKDLKNRDFVAQTNYSQQYILEIFREHLNSSPRKLLTDYRIRKSKELLVKEPNLSVEQIGHNVGFNTNSYFISTFKSREKLTPGKFREIILQ